jgi:hypothetical protein
LPSSAANLSPVPPEEGKKNSPPITTGGSWGNTETNLKLQFTLCSSKYGEWLLPGSKTKGGGGGEEVNKIAIFMMNKARNKLERHEKAELELYVKFYNKKSYKIKPIKNRKGIGM